MQTQVMIGLGGLILAALGYLAGVRKTAGDDGKKDGVVLTEIGYIKAGLDDIKKDIKDHRDGLSAISARLAAVEASAKQAHKRLDQMSAENHYRKEI